jgi:hypothetical protein
MADGRSPGVRHYWGEVLATCTGVSGIVKVYVFTFILSQMTQGYCSRSYNCPPHVIQSPFFPSILPRPTLEQSLRWSSTICHNFCCEGTIVQIVISKGFETRTGFSKGHYG